MYVRIHIVRVFLQVGCHLALPSSANKSRTEEDGGQCLQVFGAQDTVAHRQDKEREALRATKNGKQCDHQMSLFLLQNV